MKNKKIDAGVERLINKISGPKKTLLQTGKKSGKYQIREVGDIWYETHPITGAVTKWEQKQGYRVKIQANLDELVGINTRFLGCKKDKCTCTNPTRLDLIYEKKTGRCADCVISEETMLKIQGKYKQYEKEKMYKNVVSWLKDATADKDAIIQMIQNFSIVNDAGFEEKWGMDNVNEMVEKIENDFEKFKEELLNEYGPDL